MNNKMTVVIISLSMLMSLAVSAAGRPLLSGHEQRITTLEGQTSTLATDLAQIALTPGPKGDVGEAGPKGAEGVKGDVGEAGTQGTPGIKGDDGAAGNRGEDGSDGLNGKDAIAGTENGQMQYWDGDNWQIIDAPDMNTADAQVLSHDSGGFHWKPKSDSSPEFGDCPAWTLDELNSTIKAHKARTQDSSRIYSVSTAGGIKIIGWLREWGGNASYTDEWVIRLNAYQDKVTYNEEIAGKVVLSTQYRIDPIHVTHIPITSSQYSACQEILGHATLPYRS
jgi:hypothetical protein